MKLYLDTSQFKVVLRLDSQEYRANLGHQMAEKLTSLYQMVLLPHMDPISTVRQQRSNR